MKLRFGCANNVGISSWAEQLQITLPKPGRKREKFPPQQLSNLNMSNCVGVPSSPSIFIDDELIESLEDYVVESVNASVNISWDYPDSNGEAIDYFRY